MEYRQYFQNKKITLMGLGLLGRGVGDAAFLVEQGAEVTVTDLKTAEQLASSLDLLKHFKNIRFVLGRHELEDFQKAGADMVVKAAGVPLNSPFIAEAEKSGVPVTMSTALFAELTPARLIGVTGTRGKSTVTHLLYEILKEHRKNTAGKSKSGDKTSKSSHGGGVFLGGNVLGVSTLSLLPQTKVGDDAVLELDSWQLQGFTGFSPAVAVFTTFMPDHMNYYAGDMKQYFADKANIYRNQNEQDVLVVSEQVAEFIKKFGPKPRGRVVVAYADEVPESWEIKIPGEHNRLNIALALKAAQAMGVPEKTVEKVVARFHAIPGRLELVRTVDGVEFYNDTNSTTPDATLVGLKALSGASAATVMGAEKRIVLIFGGADKKLDMKPLLSVLPQYAKTLVVLPGTGTDGIRSELEELAQKNSLPLLYTESMKEAVSLAREYAKKGDKVLMSPAFASFGLFKNEYDRGDQFNECVKCL